MKKLMKNPILMFILGVIMSIGVTSVLAYSLLAPDIGFIPTDNAWKQNDGNDITNVKEAIDDLHLKINSLAFKKVCKYISNQYSHDPNDHHSVGTMYECEVADGVKKNFYILKTNNKYYRLIMDRNIVSGTMSWESANNYFNTGQPGYSIVTSWTNIYDIGLPTGQEIVDVTNANVRAILMPTNTWYCFGSGGADLGSQPWCRNTAEQQSAAWLFNHLVDCSAAGCSDESDATSNGYWTTDLPANDTSRGIYVQRYGYIEGYTSRSNSSTYGVRAVITVLDTNLYG